MAKAFKACAMSHKANTEKHTKMSEGLVDEFVKDKNDCPKDANAAMHMLVNLSNGNKKKIAPEPNVEGGLQFANAADMLCFKFGSDGHNVKTCVKMIEQPKWWIESHKDKAPNGWKFCNEWKQSQGSTCVNHTSNVSANTSNSNNDDNQC